jgi:hypothetical protein
MTFKKTKEGNGIFKSVMTAYFILVLHVLLIVGLGLIVFFFSGIVNHIVWILIGGGAITLTSACIIYKRMKKEGKSLRELLQSPLFKGRSVEVSLFGGLASIKIGNPTEDTLALDYSSNTELRQLEAPAASRFRELNELARLLENNLITIDEYNKAKEQIFDS